MKSIKLNNKVSIDLQKLIAGKMLLQAGSGGGKSYAIRRILEQSFGSIPHIILDTEGEFASLREKYDYILIGKDYDIPADPKVAALMAHRLWEKRASAIIDLYELDPKDRQIFVDNFIGAMINAPKKLWHPVLLVIDEAHEYAPENERGDYSLSMQRLASKGRKRQIAAIFATQSIASLSKRVVASCKNKLIGYASETNDVKRAAFELGFTPQEGLVLRDLDPGEFYAFGPAISKQVIKLKVGEVHTTHEFQSRSTKHRYKVAPPSAKVKQYLADLKDLPQEAAQELKTTQELKTALGVAERRIRDLERNPATKPEGPMGASIWRAHGEKYGYWDFFKSQNYQTVFDAVQKAVVKRDKDWITVVDKWKSYFKTLTDLADKFVERREVLGAGPSDRPADFVQDTPVKPITPPPEKVYSKPPAAAAKIAHRLENAATASYIDVDKKMGAGERQVLGAIAAYEGEGMTREHITVQTGYKRSTRDAYIQRLQQKGFVQLTKNQVVATQEGIEALGNDYKPLPIGRELVEHYIKTLPAGEAKVLEFLINFAHGRSDDMGAERDLISDQTGFKRSTRDAYIQRLMARQLIAEAGKGSIKVSEHLV